MSKRVRYKERWRERETSREGVTIINKLIGSRQLRFFF